MAWHITAALVLIPALMAAAGDTAPAGKLVLGGLDPVALVQGTELKGSPGTFVDHFGYRYLFASAQNKDAFLKDPGRHAVQNGGACAKMGPLSGKGSPDRFVVHDGRIFLFASDSCRDRFKAEPERYIDRADPVPEGTEEQIARAGALLDKAVEGAGGAARLERLRTYQAAIALEWKRASGTVSGSRRVTIAFPDRYREDESWSDSAYGWLLLPEGGFLTSGGAGEPADAAVRDYMAREVAREPLVLLKSRRLPGFKAVAAGAGKVGGTAVSWLDVSIHGATTRLGIDEATGRIVQTSYTGRAGAGIAPVVRDYSDFRRVDGMMIPFSVVTTFDGKPLENPTLIYQSVTLDGAIPAADLAAPPAPASKG